MCPVKYKPNERHKKRTAEERQADGENMEKHNRIAFGDKKLPLPSSFAWITIVLLINSINHGIFCAVTLNGSNSGNAIASSSSSESIFASVMTSSPSSTKSAGKKFTKTIFFNKNSNISFFFFSSFCRKKTQKNEMRTIVNTTKLKLNGK